MGRSVSTPSDCQAVAYQHHEFDEFDSEWQWQDILDNVRESCKSLWPSLDDDDQWIGREDHAILSNGHAQIGVSEYCGLVAIWLRDDHQSETPELAEHWCEQIAPKFLKTFSTLNKIGTASNGEAFFEGIAP